MKPSQGDLKQHREIKFKKKMTLCPQCGSDQNVSQLQKTDQI